MMEHAPILIIVLPLLTAFLIPLLDMINAKLRNAGVIIGSFVTILMVFLTSVQLYKGDFNPIVYTLGALNPIPYNYDFPIRIMLTIDGLSILLAFIISIIGFLSLIFAFEYMKKESGLGLFYTLCMLMMTGFLGIVLTGDLFNMYVFIEISAVASFALIAFDKDNPESIEASLKYLIVGSIASTFILIGIALLYGEYGTLAIAQLAYYIGMNPSFVGNIALALFIVGFALKCGAVPLHMWLADAYGFAPLPVAVMLGGFATKTAIYTIVRIVFTLFGVAVDKNVIGWILIIFGILSMFVGVSMALLQTDYKRLLAYHIVSQIGYMLLGIGIGFTLMVASPTISINSINGGLFHVLNHAQYKALLFMTACVIMYKTQTTNLNELGGLAKSLPITTMCFIVGAASISGIPPFNGFASKWLIYTSSAMFNPVITLIAISVSALTLASFLKVFLSAFSGYTVAKCDCVGEAPLIILIPMILLAISCILMGVFPEHIIDNLIHPATEALLNQSTYIDAVRGGL